MTGLAERIQKLAGRVCDPPGAEAFNDRAAALVEELRGAMQTGVITPKECARLTLCLRHWIIGRAAYLLMLRQRAAAEVARTNWIPRR